MAQIYEQLTDHQKNEEWSFQSVLKELHTWKERFDFEFKLEISEIAIAIDRLSHWRLGQFRYGHNGFGLKGEITISSLHIEDNLSSSCWWDVLGTLLHEQLHAWQQEHGKPGKGNYHNVEFRRKAKKYGLLIDHRGWTQYEPESLFFSLLERHGVTVPDLELPAPPAKRAAASPKLRLWMCGCPVRLRVAIPKLSARCLNCNQLFELQL